MKSFQNRAILNGVPRRSTHQCGTWRDFSRFSTLFFFLIFSFLFLMKIFQQEELEFVDDLRALYDKKLISNEAKVKYEKYTDVG